MQLLDASSRKLAGANNYTGIAQRSRVQERIAEHCLAVKIRHPVQKQMSSIADAQAKESRIISRSKPNHNKQGK
jgi:hypothetical protein